jgi:group I intron endonuclease
MNCIYKITSPSGKIYIGQTVNLKKRIEAYKGLNCKAQAKLHASLLKYGFEQHCFEVIEHCEKEELDQREAFWIKYYDCFDTKHGLNLASGGNQSRLSKESCKKISAAKIGMVFTDGHRLKLKEAQHKFYSSITDEERIKKCARFNRPRTEDEKIRISESMRGKVRSYDHQEKLRISMLGKAKYKKTVVDISTGEMYESIKDMCKALNVPYTNHTRKKKVKHIAPLKESVLAYQSIQNHLVW